MMMMRGWQTLAPIVLFCSRSGFAFLPRHPTIACRRLATTTSPTALAAQGSSPNIETAAPFSSTTTATTSSSSLPPQPLPSSFTTPPLQVYIEDTDAYGIVYYGNYITLYERALLLFFTSHSTTMGAAASRPKNTPPPTITTLGWAGQKYLAAPGLGTDYVITGEQQQQPTLDQKQSEIQLWNLKMTSLDGSIVYNTVQGLQVSIGGTSTNQWTTEPKTKTHDDDDTWPQPKDDDYRDTFTVFADELSTAVLSTTEPTSTTEIHYSLPWRSILNYMERSRTHLMGGPQLLRRLQEEDQVVVVVTHIDQADMMTTPSKQNDKEDNNAPETKDDWTEPAVVMAQDSANHEQPTLPLLLQPASQVMVETQIAIKRKGMMFDCYQTLYLLPRHDENDKSTNSGGGRRTVLARALVKLMLLNEKTRRPTNKLPMWLKERHGLLVDEQQ